MRQDEPVHPAACFFAAQGRPGGPRGRPAPPLPPRGGTRDPTTPYSRHRVAAKRPVLMNLTVAEHQFQKTQNSHSRSYSRPLFENACSRKSDFYEFPLNSRRSTRKNAKSIEDYSVFRVPNDPTNPKFVENVVFYRLILTSLFRDVAAETRGGKWSKTRGRSSSSLDFGV